MSGWFGIYYRYRGDSRKLGRNDPCSCGSGVKYKRCCLANDQAEAERQLSKSWSESKRYPEVTGGASASIRGFDRWANLRRFTFFGRLRKRR
jgi:hypothetical protein